MSTQPEALRLADELDGMTVNEFYEALGDEAAAQLRRLSAVEAQRDALLEALQALYDEQNGPPLIRHQAAWEAAMEKARAAIKAVEENT